VPRPDLLAPPPQRQRHQQSAKGDPTLGEHAVDGEFFCLGPCLARALAAQVEEAVGDLDGTSPHHGTRMSHPLDPHRGHGSAASCSALHALALASA
jgi:hypothetical protein